MGIKCNYYLRVVRGKTKIKGRIRRVVSAAARATGAIRYLVAAAYLVSCCGRALCSCAGRRARQQPTVTGAPACHVAPCTHLHGRPDTRAPSGTRRAADVGAAAPSPLPLPTSPRLPAARRWEGRMANSRCWRAASSCTPTQPPPHARSSNTSMWRSAC